MKAFQQIMREKAAWLRAGLALVFLLAAAGAFALLRTYMYTEKEPLYLTPTFGDLRGWELYRLEEGEKLPLSPEELLASDGVVCISRTLDAGWEAEGYTCLRLDGVAWQVSAFLGGELLYTAVPGSGASPDSVAFPGAYPGIQGRGEHVTVTLPAGYGGQQLTLALQRASDYAGLPMVILSSAGIDTADAVAVSARQIIPASVFLAAAVLLLGLLLYGAVQGRRDWPGLLLCLTAAFQALYHLRSFSLYLNVDSALDFPAVALVPALFITLPLVYLCACLEQVRWRWRLLALTPAAAALAAGACSIAGLPGAYDLSVLAQLAAVAAVLICTAADAGKGGSRARLFWCGAGLLALLLAVFWLLSRLGGGGFARRAADVFSLAAAGFWESPLFWCGTALFALCAFLSAEEAIRSAVQGQTRVLLLSTQLSALQSRIDSTRAAEEAIRLERHDLRHRLQTVAELAEKGDSQSILDFVQGAQRRLEGQAPPRWCRQPILDAVFSSCFRQAKQQGIEVQASIQLPDALPVDEAELAVALSNALENAIHAAAALPETDRRLCCKIISRPGLMLEISNPCPDEVRFDAQGLPLSTRAGHGLGVQSISAFCRKYGALLKYQWKDGWLSLRIIL